LAVSTNGPVNYAVTTNQIVQVVALTGSQSPALTYIDGIGLYNQLPTILLSHSSGVTVLSQTLGTYTDLTNIMLESLGSEVTLNGVTTITGVGNPGLATLCITTPLTTNVVSNYVPADAIVIPASATGNVQIILESSADLVNWTAANPGTYGASSATNRFFRVRAVTH